MSLNSTLTYLLLIALCPVARAQDGNKLSEQEMSLKLGDRLQVSTSLGITGPLLSERTTRINLNLGYNRPNWGLRGGLRRTGEDFAPYDTWLGVSQLLPRNSQDVSLAGYLNLTPNLKVIGAATRGDSLPGGSFDFTNLSTRLEYRFNSNVFGLLGFDNLNIELMSGSLMRRQWATLGFGMDMGQGNMFKLLLQYGELGGSSSFSNEPANRGHVITGQISVKF